MHRVDDFKTRRQSIAHLSEAELENTFWELALKITAPLVEMASTHTSPSIERSVLLRMGFSSLEAGAIVKRVDELGLLGKGAGHVVWRLARLNNCSLEQAKSVLLSEIGGAQVKSYFDGGVR
ncbi:MAG: ornithine aminomutase subunit alpha [bacterium]|nr:ornithine aminomutase subunit alpha [bacterium]